MKPVLFGCSGLEVTPAERSFFAEHQPAGFILFKRNVETPEQVRALTDSLKEAVGRDDVLMAVDQEGGRVQRLGPPHWRKYPTMRLFGDCAKSDIVTAELALEASTRLMADDLWRAGFNMNCAPVLDLPIEGSDEVIGDRAFSDDLTIMRELGRVVLYCLEGAGILPVIKHMPGHGRALVDSHKDLPRVSTPYGELCETDFYPFRRLKHAPFAMTAHIVFEAVDNENPATMSAKLIQQVIRHEIGYGGIVMTDDLSMHALTGPFAERAQGALRAGCDLILHCNSDMAEMVEIAKAIDPASDELRNKISDLAAMTRRERARDRAALQSDYDTHMKAMQAYTKDSEFWSY